ncbi:unnamed protein product [Rotaria sordida]|uniref:Uncharacterized protein n=1 Tax=Rotaria sordida TaxID=392033 RepID=A0A813UP07_9BILA|nr:unnamed protein product [Rotaria sordida]CAF0844116.1 unnamed protein product [Rotaria sordida]CAF0887147.1 unnamed protein product [Rotaria sordida]CAF0889518.1 unnamed protein product [Rotaria sordida]CAF3684660.1 unnamed protein product [Rotaria sordida]
MTTSSKTFWPLVAAVGLGVSFVGYCMYFDRKRRNAPDFIEKLKAKRQKQKLSSGNSRNNINMSNPESMRQYFLEQIQYGEDCLSRGDFDNGIEHLAKAILVCSQPQNLIVFFQQTLPSEIFQELINRLPRIAQSVHNPSSLSAGVPELDLE